MYTPATQYDKELVEDTVAKVEKQFYDKVERIRYSTGEDWSGDPALFFRIVLRDDAAIIDGEPAQKQEFLDLTMSLSDLLREAVNDSDLFAYVRFTTVSEQSQLRDKDWE